MDNDRVLNPKTSRYVTVGSSSHRRLMREGILKHQTKEDPVKQPHRDREYESDSELDDDKFSRKQSNKDIPIKRELVKKSVKLIQKHEDKFKKVRGDQEDTDKLLKKLLYRKLIKNKTKIFDSSDSESD